MSVECLRGAVTTFIDNKIVESQEPAKATMRASGLEDLRRADEGCNRKKGIAEFRVQRGAVGSFDPENRIDNTHEKENPFTDLIRFVNGLVFFDWWSRGESNSRPRMLRAKLLQV